MCVCRGGGGQFEGEDKVWLKIVRGEGITDLSGGIRFLII